MLANSVLPVTPTQGGSGLVSPVGETAGSASFAPVEAVSATNNTRAAPQQRPQPNTAPEGSGQADISSAQREGSTDSEGGIEQQSNQDSSSPIQAQPNEDSERSENDAEKQARNQEQQQQKDLDIIRSLSQRDAEVHAHENAHSAVGGRYAGSASYTYQRGPDGVNYAVGGEVSIDVSPIPGNPQATLEKMQLVQRAALAPAEPSSQDRKVAALASQQANQARAEIVSESRGSSSSDVDSAAEKADKKQSEPSIGGAKSTSEKSEGKAESSSSNSSSQAANERISKINELLVAISQNDTSSASGQLLDAVV